MPTTNNQQTNTLGTNATLAERFKYTPHTVTTEEPQAALDELTLYKKDLETVGADTVEECNAWTDVADDYNCSTPAELRIHLEDLELFHRRHTEG